MLWFSRVRKFPRKLLAVCILPDIPDSETRVLTLSTGQQGPVLRGEEREEEESRNKGIMRAPVEIGRCRTFGEGDPHSHAKFANHDTDGYNSMPP